MGTLAKLAAVGAGAVLLVGLVGCGAKTGQSGFAGAAPSGSGRLTVWASDSGLDAYAINQAAQLYQQDHPGFAVDVHEMSWNDMQAQLSSIAGSGQLTQLPDLFIVQNDVFQKDVIDYPQLFADLSDSGVDFSQYPQAVVADSVVDGKNWGLPFDNPTVIAAYRSDVLQQAGYTVADFTDITWADFLTKAEDVVMKTGQPLLSDQANSADLVMMMLRSAGGSLFDGLGNPTIADNPALMEAIDTYRGLVQSGVLIETDSPDNYVASFTRGDVAGVIGNCSVLSSIKSATGQSGDWVVTDLPRLTAASGATNYSTSGGSSWAISSNASDYALAASFLKSTFAGSTLFYDDLLPAGVVSSWLPAAQSSAYTAGQPFFSDDAVYAKIVGFAVTSPVSVTGAYYVLARDAVAAAVTEILQGTDPTSALQEAQDAIQFATQ